MSIRLRSAVVAVAAVISLAAPAAAQQRAGIMGELMKDITDVQGKLAGLARTMPADKYDWRPAAAAMQVSFAHLLKTMADTPDARLDERVKFFGQDMSVRQVWVLTASHLHEHLGQSIAYARTNGVTPPWSQKSQ